MCVYYRKNVKISAVCRFSLSEVQRVFDGPYMENQDYGAKWSEYTGKVPDPRPGSVSVTHAHASSFALQADFYITGPVRSSELLI